MGHPIGVKRHEVRHTTGGIDAFLTTDVIEAICKRLRETSGPTTLAMGAISDGQFLKRSGTSIVGSAGSSGGGIAAFFTPVTKTTNYTVSSGDAGSILKTTGAVAQVTFQLLAATGSGGVFGFYSDAAQVMEVLCNGTDTIRWGNDVSAAGGNIQTTTAGRGDVVLLWDYGSGTWLVLFASETTMVIT